MVEGLKGGMIPQRPAEGRGSAAAAPAERLAAPAAEGMRPGATMSGTGATGLKGLVRDLAKTPPVDPARVEALRDAIAGGRYPIDPARIADAMIAMER